MKLALRSDELANRERSAWRAELAGEGFVSPLPKFSFPPSIQFVSIGSRTFQAVVTDFIE
jgi:hypothetical protein